MYVEDAVRGRQVAGGTPRRSASTAAEGVTNAHRHPPADVLG